MAQKPRKLDPSLSARALFGYQLRLLRDEADMAQAHLGSALHVTGEAVATWEKGRSLPDERTATHADEILQGRGLLLAAWRFAAQGPVANSGVSAPTRFTEPETLGGSDPFEPWQLTDAITRSNLSADAVDAMQDAVFGYAAAYPSTAPGDLLALVDRQARRLTIALAQPQRLAVRRRCIQLSAIVCGLAANVSIDLGESRKAAAYFKTAHLAAAEAEDTQLTAWILANQSIHAFIGQRPDTAVDLLQQASELLAQSAHPRQQAWTSALLARAQGAVGDQRTAARCIDAAHIQLDQAAQPPGGIVFFDQPRLHGLAGAAYLLSGDATRAEEQLATAFSQRAESDRKGRALLAFDLAACHMDSGDVDQAYAMATYALDLADGTVVRPIVLRAREMQARMAARGPGRSARELEARVAALDDLPEE